MEQHSGNFDFRRQLASPPASSWRTWTRRDSAWRRTRGSPSLTSAGPMESSWAQPGFPQFLGSWHKNFDIIFSRIIEYICCTYQPLIPMKYPRSMIDFASSALPSKLCTTPLILNDAVQNCYIVSQLTQHRNEACTSDKFTPALSLLFHQIYAICWGHMKVLGILFKWGYDTLISNRRWLNDRPKCWRKHVSARTIQKAKKILKV